MVSVSTIGSYTVFAWFMLFMMIRRIVMIALSIVLGRHRPFPPGTHVPEDRILKSKHLRDSFDQVAAAQFPKEYRINKATVNDTENDTHFCILILATAVYSDNIGDTCTKTIVYSAIYLLARIFYVTSYLFAMQPWRTIAFFAGLLVTLACNIDLVVTTSSRAT